MTNKGVLFDVDGTLCDTNYLHAVAWSRALREMGEDAPMSALHHHIGMGSDKFTEAVMGHHNEKASEAHGRIFKTMYEEVRAFEGAGDLIRKVASVGIRPVLASSADPEQLEVMRKVIGADEALYGATHAEDAEASKPEPDIFIAALEKSDLAADNCVVVGDTVWDVKAAIDAGIACIGVLTGGISEAELKEAGAIAVYDSVKALLDDFDNSPIATLLK